MDRIRWCNRARGPASTTFALREEAIGLGSYGRVLTILTADDVPDPDDYDSVPHRSSRTEDPWSEGWEQPLEVPDGVGPSVPSRSATTGFDRSDEQLVRKNLVSVPSGRAEPSDTGFRLAPLAGARLGLRGHGLEPAPAVSAHQRCLRGQRESLRVVLSDRCAQLIFKPGDRVMDNAPKTAWQRKPGWA